MGNKRKACQANGLKLGRARGVGSENYLSIKPCTIRIKRLVWHPKPLQNIDEITKSSRRQQVAGEIIKPQYCLDGKKMALTTRQPTYLKDKNIRKMRLNKSDISNTHKIISDNNNRRYAKPSTKLMETEQNVAAIASNVDHRNAGVGITSTVATKQRIRKEKIVKNLSQQKQNANYSKQVPKSFTKPNQKANAKGKVRITASKEMSNEFPKAIFRKYLFAKRKSKKLCEDKCIVDEGQNNSLLLNGSVYEFHSQSTIYSNTGRREDPSADIIRKLINQGKVRVATRAKGKGKPIVKRETRKKGTVQKKVQFDNRTKAQTTSAISSAKIKTDTNRDNIVANNKPDSLITSGKAATTYAKANPSLLPLCQHFENNSSFSPLAQLVLRKQANKFNHTETAPQTAVQYIKPISTPIKQHIDPAINLSYSLSPIQSSSPAKRQHISYISSPWRVDNETNLPKIFNFNLTSDCCPSFSSDFIDTLAPGSNPADGNALKTFTTASSAKTPMTGVEKLSKISQNAVDDGEKLHGNISEIMENIENLPPPVSLDNFNTSLKSFSESNLLENATQRRLPLKPITILNVVELPPWKTVSTTSGTVVNNEKNIIRCESNQRKEHSKLLMKVHEIAKEDNNSNFEQAKKTRVTTQKQRTLSKQFSNSFLEINSNIVEHSFPNESSPRKYFENSWDSEDDIQNEVFQLNYQAEEKPSEDEEDRFLFGFEEYFKYITSQPNREIDLNIRNKICDERSLHEKLSDLKKLRPQLNPASFSPATKSNLPYNNIFDCNLKQRKIDQLFYNQKIKNTDKSNLEKSITETNCMGELFSNEHEIEPGLIDKKKIKRNYLKGWKRKSRLIERQYTICLDSDESEEELNTDNNCIKQWKANAAKPSPKKRGRPKAKKENPELTRYIESFNAMCNEVEKFNLIVEKAN